MRSFCAALAVWLGLHVPALARSPDETGEAAREAEIFQAVEETQNTTFTTVIVEGEDVAVRMREAEAPDGELLLDADPIIRALNSSWETRDALLLVRRFQDGANMLLDMRDGKVRGNGVVLGALPGWQSRETADAWLTLNAISVLTGTRVSRSEADGRYVLTLDDRLRPQFGLELYIDGRQVAVDEAAPRTIGPVLLVPLRPIAGALGSEVEVNANGNEITVRRSQDSSVIILNLDTGLITVNGSPRGITPNIAYAERQGLLLPFTAVETLTGTHVKLRPGSSRVDITLDQRLTAAAMPGESVDADTAGTPFTPESLEFSISDAGTNEARFNSRWKGFNTQMRYQSSGSIMQPAALAPSFIALDVRAQSGWAGTLGDYNGDFGETIGVGVSRSRGLSWRRKTDEGGVLAVSVGAPLTGSETSDGDVSRPVFGGFVAGARRLSADGRREVALSGLSKENGDGRVVASYQRQFAFQDREQGVSAAGISGDVGVFDDAAGTSVDIRARGNLQYRFGSRASVRMSGSYDGARFFASPAREARGDISEDAARLAGALGGGDARVSISAAGDWRAESDWGVFRAPALAARVSYAGQGVDGAVSTTGAFSTRLGENGPNVSLSLSRSDPTGTDGDAASTGFAARAFQRFSWGAVTAGYNWTGGEQQDDRNLVATASINPWVKRLPRNATVSVGPSASLAWSPDNQSARLGASAGFDAGNAFGERFRLSGSVSAAQSVNPDESRTDFVATMTGRYRLTRSLDLRIGYVDDLRDRRSLSIGLVGAFQFNAPRRYSDPDEDRGVLKGRVFFDRNRDGIRQADEPGIGGVVIRVARQGLALRADGQGHYTIQNLPPGIYSLMVDTRALPLGMQVPEDVSGRATVAQGRITELDIPVIASGQIRGAVFIDRDGNGEPSPGEDRLEGVRIDIMSVETGETRSQRAAAFGQYGFENLGPGDYRIEVVIRDRVALRTEIAIDEKELFRVVPLALPPPPEPPLPGPERETDKLLGTAP